MGGKTYNSAGLPVGGRLVYSVKKSKYSKGMIIKNTKLVLKLL